MQHVTTIEVSKEDIKFSAAHFTIFSATERERLHGHNYFVSVEFSAPVGDNGICFSYKEIKDRLRAICDSLDEYMLLPQHSPHLTIEEDGLNYRVRFAEDTLYFLKADTIILPVRNTTLEEFSRYLLECLLADGDFMRESGMLRFVLKVSSGAGQWGSASWEPSSKGAGA